MNRLFEGNKLRSNKLDEVDKKHIELAESVIRENIEQEWKKEGQKDLPNGEPSANFTTRL